MPITYFSCCEFEHIQYIATAMLCCTRPCITNVIATCRKNFSQWERSFLWKLRCHWLKFLRRVAKNVSNTGSRVVVWHRSRVGFTNLFVIFWGIFDFGKNICWVLLITFIFDDCHCSSAVVTPVKYERYIQLVASVFIIVKNRENDGIEKLL